ncbi:CPBP family intramembrane glutamic endopeptidase [Marinilactibacillus kalidii]|uniref:CPBP family intramembrane glutamic endopeptidase n=1 Tax=Marinilactibacillus kalidii TaxID=2820274 RepID=UPI001ABEDA77|nr:type II CAAX endopeptidase family protein [Marinilactibacillus kalidii]
MEIKKMRNTGLKIVSIYLIVQLLSVASQLLPSSIQPTGSILSQIFLFIFGASLMIYLDRKDQFNLPYEQAFRHRIGRILLWGILGVFLAVILQFLALQIEVRFFGTPVNSQNTVTLLAIIRQYPYFVMITSIAGPIMEEFVFRKVLFGLSLGKLGGIGAGVISSLAFALFHIDGRILVYSTMGLVFSWVYYKSGNIWAPILAHCLMNTLVVLQTF